MADSTWSVGSQETESITNVWTSPDAPIPESNISLVLQQMQDTLDAANAASEAAASAASDAVSGHTSRTDNPHSTTAAQLGLGNVDDTSDANKPISTAAQIALNLKIASVSSTDNAVVRFDGASGAVQNSGAIIDDYGNLHVPAGGGIVSNEAFGTGALKSNTTGHHNSAVGSLSLYYNTTGSNNSAVGSLSLLNNTTGGYNSAVGQYALLLNTTGSGNSAFNPINSNGDYAPVFNPITENNRFCMGSTGVTNAYIQVAWTVVSDARDKTDFAPVPHGLDFVTKLKPTAYRYKIDRDAAEGHGPVRYGFKAQDVLELEGDIPVVVDAEDADKLRFNDQSLIAVLVNAIQELSEKVGLQAEEIAILKGK